MSQNLPQDPIILLSYVNTQLRDHYATLAEFCAAMGADRAELEKKLAAAEAQKKADDDKYLRMLAEYDNFRRRAAKEKDGVYADAYSDAIGALLPVLDNLDRAVGCKDPEALAGGLALTLKSFNEALGKLGVEEIKADGETFDPNLHNAVMHVDDESAGDGQVVEVFQKGYKKGDKVIRHAVVKVAN